MRKLALVIVLIAALTTACTDNSKQASEWYAAQLNGIRERNDCDTYYSSRYGPDDNDVEMVFKDCPMDVQRQLARVQPPKECDHCRVYHKYLLCVIEYDNVDQGQDKCNYILNSYIFNE